MAPISAPRLLGSQRLQITLLLSLAILIAYAQRNGLSSLIVSMCKDDNGTGYYEWKNETGIILGSFYVGYALLQLAGGYLVAKWNGYHAISIFMALSSVATLLGPFAANAGWQWMAASRVIAGLGQAVVWPSIYGITAIWFPKDEKSTLMGMVGGSQSLGTVLALFFGGLFCRMSCDQPYFFSGWAIFHYILGVSGLLWLLLWHTYAYKSPDKCPSMHIQEFTYIRTQTDVPSETSSEVPWMAIISSKHVWGLCLTMMLFDFGLYATFTVVPTYLREGMGFSFEEMGLYSALPHVVCLLGCLVSGYASDVLINQRIMSRTNCRKLFQCGSAGLVGISMAAIAFIPKSLRIASVCLFLLCGLFMSLTLSAGYFIAVSEIAGRYSSLVFGMGNTMSAIAGFLSPTVANAIVSDKTGDSLAKWRIVMLVYAGSMFLAAIVFAIFGSGVQCKWVKNQSNETNIEEVISL